MIYLLLLLPSFALAKSYPDQMQLSVPIPRSELKIQVPEERDYTPSTVELALSSWKPQDFQRADYRRQQSSFTRSLPQFSLNYRSPFWSFSRGAVVSWKTGLSVAGLERTRPSRGRGDSITQTIHLYQARLGLEYDGPLWSNLLQPFVGLSAAPTLGLASQSELENSVSALGLPFELNGGILLHTGWDFLGFSNGTLGLGGHYLVGSLEESRLTGWGVQMFVRVGL